MRPSVRLLADGASGHCTTRENQTTPSKSGRPRDSHLPGTSVSFQSAASALAPGRAPVGAVVPQPERDGKGTRWQRLRVGPIRAEEPLAVPVGGDIQRAAQPPVAVVGGVQTGGVDGLACPGRRGHVGQPQDRRQSCVQVGILQQAGAQDRGRRLRARRQHHRRRLPDAGGGVLQCPDGRAAGLGGRARQLTETVQRPQRVQRGAIGADCVNGGVAHEADELRHDVPHAALDEQTLRVEPPEHVV